MRPGRRDRLDCLVIGYHDQPFPPHEQRVLAQAPGSAERQILAGVSPLPAKYRNPAAAPIAAATYPDRMG